MTSEKIALLRKLIFSIGWSIKPVDGLNLTEDCFIVGDNQKVDDILNLINSSSKPLKIQKKEIDWIDEYRDLFPVGIRSGGFPIRGDRKGCIKKMENFLETYPEYSKETILKATKSYVDRKAVENFAYMQLAHYFIKKDDISSLASECESLKEDTEVKETMIDI